MNFLHLLAAYRTPFLDCLFQLFTILAQEIVVVLVICWLYWCQNKKLAYSLGFTYFISGLFVQALKITFRIPRPWILDPDFSPAPSAVEKATGYSFPSGHTQSGTALFSTLGFVSDKIPLRILCFALVFAIGFSRLYLGVHTPKDVLTSFLITIVISYLVFKSAPSLLEKGRHTGKISSGLLFISILLIVYAWFLRSTHTVDPLMAEDALKAAGAGLGFAAGFYLEQKYIKFTVPSSAKEKALRFSTGLLSIILLMLIFELTIKKFLIGEIISYFLLILWITAGYPALFEHLSEK